MNAYALRPEFAKPFRPAENQEKWIDDLVKYMDKHNGRHVDVVMLMSSEMLAKFSNPYKLIESAKAKGLIIKIDGVTQ